MKAIVQDQYGPPEILRLEEIDKPVPGDDEVLVRVHAAGVDPGVWHLMTGLPYLIRVMGFGLKAPKTRVRGSDLAGRVEAIGANVTRFRPGDEVFGTCNGAFAEYTCVPVDRLALKPRSLDMSQAAAVPTSGTTALQGLRDIGEVEPRQEVLVIGAGGGVGTFAVQIAKVLGADVTGVCSAGKTALVTSLGADDVIDYTHEDFTDGARRYDLILDTAGNRPLAELRRALTSRGTLVIVGGEGGGRWLGGVDRQLRAALLSPLQGQRLRPLFAEQREEDLQFLAELIDAGRVRPVIDRQFSLEQVPDAVRYLAQGRATGKVVVTL